jgi:hypothetical protein
VHRAEACGGCVGRGGDVQACKAALVGHRAVTQPGDMANKSVATRVGDTQCSDMAATSLEHAMLTL